MKGIDVKQFEDKLSMVRLLKFTIDESISIRELLDKTNVLNLVI